MSYAQDNAYLSRRQALSYSLLISAARHPIGVAKVIRRDDPLSPEAALAANLRALMSDRHETQTALGARCTVPQQQISRALGAKHSVTLTTVAGLAAAYGLAPYQMLIPGLDVRKPQSVPVTKQERELYARLQEAARAITG